MQSPAWWFPAIPEFLPRISPSKYHNFAPRIGLAYSPKFDRGLLKTIFGDGGKSSLRASYGIFYTAFPGISAGIMYAVPPFGYNYLSPGPPLFATPFVNASDGTVNTNPYPLTFPPHTVSAKNPYTAFDWAAVTPDQRRSLLLLPQRRALHRELHAVVPAPDHQHSLADDELRGKPRPSHSGALADERRQCRALPEPQPAQ